MTTHISPQGEQPISTTNPVEEAQPAMPLQLSAPHPIILPKQPEEEEFFSFEDEQPDPVQPLRIHSNAPMQCQRSPRRLSHPTRLPPSILDLLRQRQKQAANLGSL